MTETKPNIFWITLDSVRADHTSLHGYGRDTTPELSRIADSPSGVQFQQGIAHSTRTPVSVPSMFTGLVPSCHQMIGQRSGDALPTELDTVPDLLSEIGYHTIGISENGYAGKAKNIDIRFDEFVKSSPTELSDFLTYDMGTSFLKYWFNVREHGPGFTANISAHGKQNSFFTSDIAKRKIRRYANSSDPIFCYIHYNDPHHPYVPPSSFMNEYTSEIDATAEEAVEFSLEMHDKMYEWMADELPLSGADWAKLNAMYDACIKYTDTCVGALFDFITERFDNAIVVITADHGDLFGEYGLLGHHMVLHDGLIHVPLITHGLREVTHHADRPTQHIDIMKTLLSVVRADTSEFQGYDIRTHTREVAISQDYRGSVDDPDSENYERIKKHNPNVDLSHLPASMVTAARTRDFKLIHTEESTKLFQLPDELTDVKNEFPNVHSELCSFVNEWLENEGTPIESSPMDLELTGATKKHLEEMGYL
ncbi:sulfatase-like hydrolase/transferase [Halorubrum sp. FL23]|uniref:sulfatase-like hydrolase/transferase n=1 Tax=Halorubrum sp. FL23 TaxID=3458704 RepID=UPI00403473FF